MTLGGGTWGESLSGLLDGGAHTATYRKHRATAEYDLVLMRDKSRSTCVELSQWGKMNATKPTIKAGKKLRKKILSIFSQGKLEGIRFLIKRVAVNLKSINFLQDRGALWLAGGRYIAGHSRK